MSKPQRGNAPNKFPAPHASFPGMGGFMIKSPMKKPPIPPRLTRALQVGTIALGLWGVLAPIHGLTTAGDYVAIAITTGAISLPFPPPGRRNPFPTHHRRNRSTAGKPPRHRRNHRHRRNRSGHWQPPPEDDPQKVRAYRRLNRRSRRSK